MPKKKALAAAILAPLALAGLFGIWTLAPGAPGAAPPPLEGVFASNFTLLDRPVPAPLETFQDLQGNPTRLADFTGRVVVLNFWATWCPPCLREMPSLDRLQAALGAEGLTVLAVSLDRRGKEVVLPFLNKNDLARLAVFLDPEGILSRAFGVQGLPTTYLIDAENRIIGAIQGPAEWDAPEALALVRHYLKKSTPDTSGVVKTGGREGPL